MRIAQLIETLGMGGAENLAVNIANELAAAGHESHLIVTGHEGPLAARIDPTVTLRCLGFARASVRNPLAFALSLRRARRLLGEVLAAGRIEVVQSHLPGANFLGLLVARAGLCAVLPTVHNNQEFNYGEVDNRLLRRARKAAYRRMLTDCQGMIAVSETVRESMAAELGVSGDAITVVPNAVPLPAPVPAAERDALRRRCGAGPDEILLLAAGRFCAQKNFGDLVPLMSALAAAGVPARLVAAGEGESRAAVAAAFTAAGLDDRVLLPGNLSDLDRVMGVADVFVMTSLWEGLPLVLLEALAAGLPAVAYGIPGVDELIGDGRAGRTAPVGQPDALAARIRELASDRDGRRALGEAGRELIRHDYGMPTMIARLVAIYGPAVAAFGDGVA